ncbi:hypothetical protein ACJX0J_017653 [Zea mays]
MNIEGLSTSIIDDQCIDQMLQGDNLQRATNKRHSLLFSVLCCLKNIYGLLLVKFCALDSFLIVDNFLKIFNYRYVMANAILGPHIHVVHFVTCVVPFMILLLDNKSMVLT